MKKRKYTRKYKKIKYKRRKKTKRKNKTKKRLKYKKITHLGKKWIKQMEIYMKSVQND